MTSAPARNTHLDIFKSLLVMAMIATHAIAILGIGGTAAQGLVELAGREAAYSGFMFCYGYAAQRAYFGRGAAPLRRMLPGIARTLMAYTLSGVAVRVIFEKRLPDSTEILGILLFSDIPAFSEFLPGFALTLLAAALLQRPLQWIVQRRRRFLAAAALLLGTTLFPYHVVSVPQIGLWVGAPEEVGALFPVLQYFVFFLAGMAAAVHPPRMTPLMMGAGVAGMALAFVYTGLGLPITRFPPSPQWIVSTIPFVVVGYGAAQVLDRSRRLRRALVPIGANSLLYLLLSNLLLFAIATPYAAVHLSLASHLAITAAIIGAIYFCISLVRPMKAHEVEPKRAGTST